MRICPARYRLFIGEGAVLGRFCRTPVDLAEIAEAALALGMPDIGQQILDAAYDAANGLPCEDLESMISQISRASLARGRLAPLSERQYGLLSIPRAC